MKGPCSKKTVVVVAALAFLVVAVVISCSTLDHAIVAPPEIPGATYVGMETCAPCHEKVTKDFKLTFHARVTIPGEGERVEGTGCEGCHGAGSLHVDKSGPDTNGGYILNPQKDSEPCFQCHIDKKAQFNLPYHHPLREGRMSCIDCHDPHGEKIRQAKGLRIVRENETCYQCHREQARPHVFEHEALREGCITCHDVHGSINQKMLTERDANLCLKCHAQNPSGSPPPRTIFIGNVNHTAFLAQGVCFSAGCHTGIHGSNINSHLRY